MTAKSSILFYLKIEKARPKGLTFLSTQELFSDFCKVFKSTNKLCSV